MPNRPPVLDKPWRRPGTWRYAAARLRELLRPAIRVTPAPADVAVDRDVAVPTRDGTLLRANVFRSRLGDEPKPVILSVHPYGKDNLPKRRRLGWSYSFQYRILRQPDPVQFSALTGWEAPDRRGGSRKASW
jgi:predicted acyl esterase